MMPKVANDNAPPSVTVSAPIRFLSVCSGIEAASVAWKPLGWQAVAFSEIEKFPSAVLGHHYPDVPNLGDFTEIDTKTLGRVDILCGGTPCQAFSVAGARGGLNDARGNLTLAFVELAHELADGNGLRNAVWENVPGVFSDKTNAFGCFLAGLVGADAPLPPPAGRTWPDAGMVSGPKGRAAWTVLDAQHFGLAQRRKRVIVVADFGNGADPAAVLFERKSMFGYSPTRREAGQGVAPTISARTKGGGGLGTDFDLDGGLVEAARVAPTVSTGARGVGDFELGGGLAVGYAPEIARCVATREGSSQDYETTTMVAVEVAPTMRAGGNQTGGDRPYGTDVDTCDSLVVHAIQAGALRENPASGPDGVGVQADIAYTLEARSEVRAIAFDTTQITSSSNYSNPRPCDLCHPLAAGAHAPAIAFNARQDPIHSDDCAQPLGAKDNGNGLLVRSAVRRLTPVECERLQGFPDDYTNIPWRGKPISPDGPRYKALGNSWAVPKFRWVGERITRLLADNDNTARMEAV